MKTRRSFLQSVTTLGAIAFFSSRFNFAQQSKQTIKVPADGRIKVAFMIGDNTNMIDTAGPWEVFQDAHGHSAGGEMSMPFQLFTVAPEDKIYRMTGGMQVKPDYTISNAPQPQIIVIPAHRATDASRAWLKQASDKNDVTMSVCTGAFQLARTGLLDGKTATTHHDFWDSFDQEFASSRKIKLQRGLRFIDHGRIATAGGLTSGIDLALHIVSRYLGIEAAKRTATYMEYSSEAWRA
jgi:transcriptional regulator GlxA family with amidase domain